MRVLLIACLVVSSAVLAGCAKVDESSGAVVSSTTTRSTTSPTGATGANGLPVVTALPPLAAKMKPIERDWVEPGTAVTVKGEGIVGAVATSAIWAVGALPGTVAVTPAKVDTGSASASQYIAPDGTKTVTFATAGLYEMHCHPHAWMRSNVTVIEGYKGPASVDVFILDGSSPSQSVYYPDRIVIAPGTKVNYKNVGAAPHTATQLNQTAPLKLLTPDTAGSVTLAGAGWQRVHYLAAVPDGRWASATDDVYVAAFPKFEAKKVAIDVPVGGLPAGVEHVVTAPFDLAYPATLNVTYQIDDALSANDAPASLLMVSVAITNTDSKEKTLSSDKPAGTLAGAAPKGAYALSVDVMQGVLVTGSVTIDAVYDTATLVPPAPVMASAGGDDHGGHAH